MMHGHTNINTQIYVCCVHYKFDAVLISDSCLTFDLWKFRTYYLFRDTLYNINKGDVVRPDSETNATPPLIFTGPSPLYVPGIVGSSVK